VLQGRSVLKDRIMLLAELCYRTGPSKGQDWVILHTIVTADRIMLYDMIM